MTKRNIICGGLVALTLAACVMQPPKVKGYSDKFIQHLCANANVQQRCDYIINQMTQAWATESALIKQNQNWSRGETDDVNFVLKQFEDKCPM